MGLFATAVLALTLPCFLYDLNLSDEPRVAHTSFEMLRTGELVLPTVNGEPFLHTPPGFYWLLALEFRLLGTRPEGIARLLPVACAAGTLLVTFLLTRRHAGRRAAFLSVAALASTFHFWDIGHRVTVDMALTLATNVALLCFAAIVLDSRVRWWSGPAFGVALGIAFLIKGIVGPGFLAAVVALTLALHRDLWTRGRALALASSMVTLALVVLPWIGALYARDPAYPSQVLLEHVWERATGGMAHDPSNWQFFHRMLLHAMPWTILFPFVFYHHARRAFGGSIAEDRNAARFSELLLLSFLLPLTLLLVSRGKRNLYLLPAMPSVAMLTGTWLDTWLETRSDTRIPERIATAVVWACAVAGAAGLVATLLSAPGGSSGLVVAVLVVHFYLTLRWLRRRYLRRGALPASEARSSAGPAWPGSPARAFEDRAGTVSTALLLALLCVAAWGSFYHVMRNPRYTAAPLGERMVALEGEGYRIVSFDLFEREYAAVAWYLRHPIPHVDTVEELDRLLRTGTSPPAGRGRPGAKTALLVEAGQLEALAGRITGWNEVYRTKLRRRGIVVMVPP